MTTKQELIEPIRKSKMIVIYIINIVLIIILFVFVGYEIYWQNNYIKTTGKITSYEISQDSNSTINGNSRCRSSYYWFEIIENSEPKKYKTIVGDCGLDRPLNQPINILYQPGNTQSVVIDDFSRWIPVVIISTFALFQSCFSVYSLLKHRSVISEKLQS